MALELYMIGLITHDMRQSLDFYRRLGLAIPAASDGQTHVEIRMAGGLTFFLDSDPARWDPAFPTPDPGVRPRPAAPYSVILEFYLPNRTVLDTKYQELLGCGYQSR